MRRLPKGQKNISGLHIAFTRAYVHLALMTHMQKTEMTPDETLSFLLETCKKAGASDADARFGRSMGENVSVLNGKLETIERDESAAVALRCFYGKSQANVSGTDLTREGLTILATRCAKMAKASPEDPYCGLVAPDMLAHHRPEFDLSGDADYSPDRLQAEALEAEAAALDVAGIAQVDSCTAGWGQSESWFAATNGFREHHAGGSSGIGLSAVAQKDGAMERDYASRSSRRRADRLSPYEIGKLAGERTIARLGPTKLSSRKAAIIYDKRISASLLSAFKSAISGPSIARGVSFLKDKLGEQVFAKGMSIIDDPFRPRGMGTRSSDGEGLPVQETALIADGVLTTWLLNSPSARQLGLQPNGFSSTAFGDPPGISTSNLYMAAGELSVEEMMQQTGEGLIVTSMFGPSINPNSGDYSVGVAGIWYEQGAPAYPVSEVTIAGDLPSMFARLIPASDLEFLSSQDAPSLLIEDMTIAGT